MISWIQRTLQQHFKWLFILLLGVVIVSFVFITNTSGGMGSGGDRTQPPKPFFGLDISLAPDQRKLADDARLSVFLRFNPSREISDAELSQYALTRHATLALADRLGLPAPTQEQLLAHIRTQRAFAAPDTGEFDPKRYAEFTDSLTRNPRLTEGDVSRVLAADARLVAYQKLLAGPGYVMPSDVAEILARRDTTWTLSVASIDGTNFSPAIDTSQPALAAWFETNARRYEIPPRVSVAALRISHTPFLDSVTLTEKEIRAAYDAAPARYPAPQTASTPGQDPDAAFASVRSQVENDLRKRRAEQAALKAAADLGVQLFDTSTKPAGLPAFVAARQNLELVEIGAVGPDTIPPALGGNTARAIANEALRLSADRPYSNPVALPDGAAILVWRENIPARLPALDEVRDQALADYTAAEKRRLFNEAGRALRNTAATAVAAGKSLETAVTQSAASSGLVATVKTHEPFSLAGNFPRDIDYAILGNLDSLSKGQIGDFIPVAETTGRIIHVVDQKKPVIDPASAEYTRLRDAIATEISQSSASALISHVVEAELAKTAPAIDQSQPAE